MVKVDRKPTPKSQLTGRTRVLPALLAAVAVPAIQLLAAVWISTDILWQVRLMQHFAGPGPVLGYKHGQPVYEGTPVHLVAAVAGLGIGVAVYWLLGWFIIGRWRKPRRRIDG